MPCGRDASQKFAEVVIGSGRQVDPVVLRQLSKLVLRPSNLSEQPQWIELRCHLAEPQFHLLYSRAGGA